MRYPEPAPLGTGSVYFPRTFVHTSNIPFGVEHSAPNKGAECSPIWCRPPLYKEATLHTRLNSFTFHSASVEAQDLRGASFPNWRGPSCLKSDRAAAHIVQHTPRAACPTGPPLCAYVLRHAFGLLRFFVMYISSPEDLAQYPDATAEREAHT
jgi:hypothetical protein